MDFAQSAAARPRVELEVYSGRPNPSWTLDAQDAAELRRRLAGLPEGSAAADTSAALGYRGVRVSMPEANAASDEVVVARGGVAVRRGSAARAFRDEGRALERWLIETGRGALDPDLYAYVVREVRQGGG